MSDYIVFISMALFWVYMERHGRWTLFIQALEGKLALPSPQSS